MALREIAVVDVLVDVEPGAEFVSTRVELPLLFILMLRPLSRESRTLILGPERLLGLLQSSPLLEYFVIIFGFLCVDILKHVDGGAQLGIVVAGSEDALRRRRSTRAADGWPEALSRRAVRYAQPGLWLEGVREGHARDVLLETANRRVREELVQALVDLGSVVGFPR